MIDVRDELASPQRQSQWAIAFLALRTLRSIGLVQLFLFIGLFFARLPSTFAVAGALTIIAIALFVIAALQWWRYTFMIDGDELVVRRGVLQRQRLSMPLDRIQSVSLEQQLLHRLVSLTQISVDTAGTDTSEFVIDAVNQDVARALQRRVGSARVRAPGTPADLDSPPPPPPPATVVVQHSPGRILAIALAQMPLTGLVLFGPLFAMADELGRFLPFDPPDFSESDFDARLLLWLVPVLLAIGLVVSIALNIARVFLTDYQLTVRSTSTGLRRDAGLLSTTSVAAPLPRIQIIGISQSLLERLFGLHTVQLATIGTASLRVPGCRASQVEALRALALQESPGVDTLDQRVSSAEVYRSTRNAAFRALVFGTGLWFLIGWWSVLIVVTVGYEWLASRRRVRLRRWALSSDAVGDHRQFLGWSRQETLLRKINMVSLTQTIFERRRDLATVRFATAAGTVSIGMLPLAQAASLRDRALHAVETDHHIWM